MAWLKSLNPAAVIEQLQQKIVSLQQQWRGGRRENERLRQEIEQLRQQREPVERERDRLRQENEKLKQQLEHALRASKRQAAPCSRGQRKQNPQRPGRKPGDAYGEHHRKRLPGQVDEVIAVPAPARCPDCGGALQVEDRQAQYQQEIVRKTFWRRFDIPICGCTVWQRRVPGRHPLRRPRMRWERPGCNWGRRRWRWACT